MNEIDIFIKELNKFNISVSDTQKKQFLFFLEDLLSWNEKFNLTGFRTKKDIIEKLFLDSCITKLSIKNLSDIKVTDIGTGAGFPGICLSILLPKVSMTLVDSNNKKVEFLKLLKENLNLSNTTVISARCEELGRSNNYREKFDYVTAKALAPLNILLEYSMPLLKVNGMLLALKGKKYAEEIEGSKKAFKLLNCEIIEIKNLKLEDIYDECSILVIKKTAKTDKRYPRQTGIPSKKPIQ
jgi:16S rRNA (guanine527-N7)-methyltransferase